ncbi:hypothetical protein T459_19236 [Capsicum annuum]|uniref:Ubiquitin-like protease family profile domain-containing protein n=1 Tax=Capsicum annuum TaxID=4072 RepID=A0A2G2Z180_CAPAN|nr:hypothetical protein T459_19236 [Capsicum annuum]
MLFFLTLRYVQTLSDPKVVDGIKMELFGATTITRKTILEGGANDAPLTDFETTSHYDYDHNGCTNFSPYFAVSSKCFSCKCQDCKVKHDGVINAINVLTATVKKMTSKRGVISLKRISYLDTPLEIKAAKRRRKDTFKASSIIKKKIATPLSFYCTDAQCARATEEQHELKTVDVTATAKEHNMTVDNPSTASKDEEKVKPVSLGERKNYPFERFNILDEARKKTNIVDQRLFRIDCRWAVKASCRTSMSFLLPSKKAKLQTQKQYRYTTGNYLYKVYINNAYDRYCQQQPEVFRNEECLINIIKGFSIPAGLPWNLVEEVYIPISCGDEFHWVLAVVVLKERRIQVYDSIS